MLNPIQLLVVLLVGIDILLTVVLYISNRKKEKKLPFGINILKLVNIILILVLFFRYSVNHYASDWMYLGWKETLILAIVITFSIVSIESNNLKKFMLCSVGIYCLVYSGYWFYKSPILYTESHDTSENVRPLSNFIINFAVYTFLLGMGIFNLKRKKS